MLTDIDWNATGSMLAGWATLAGAVAVVYAARTGANTFGAWKRQKQEERRMDAAEKILTLAYRLKRNLTSVRNPGMLGYEIETAKEKLSGHDWYDALTEAQKAKAQTAQAILLRLIRYQEDWDKIFELMPIALALFGEPVESHLQSIWRQVVAVRVSAETYATYDGADAEFQQRIERDIWEIGGAFAQEDQIGLAIGAAVTGLEAVLLPVIRTD
jgi:hypothetical protein